MRAVMAYMASRNNGNSNEMRQGGNQNNYGEARGYSGGNQGDYGEMRGGGGNRNEYNEMRQGGNRNEMRGGNQDNYDEMRRGGGGNRSEYGEMRGEYGGAESRYRGRDGRWRAGRRRSEMDGGMGEEWQDEMPEDARAYDARNEYQPQQNNYGRAESRYKPEYPIAPMDARGGLYDGGGGIGFGTRDREYETRSHYESGENANRQSAKVGGMMWMEPQEGGMDMKLDRETAEKWVRAMRNEDSARPTGPRWSMDELKPMAQKFGIKPDSEEFIEFFAMTNAMYSDYCGVAKKFNITSPEFYGLMALAWMRDKDAVPNKTAMYYECCVKK